MNLSKQIVLSEKLNLNKASDSILKKLRICLGWKENNNGGADFDPDVSLVMLSAPNAPVPAKDFYYYNNLVSPDGEQRQLPNNSYEVVRRGYITHNGDNQVGSSTIQDNETIDIDLSQVPSHLTAGVIIVTIHKAKERNQTFGMMTGAYIRLVNSETNQELGKLDLDFDASNCVGTVFGSIMRRGSDWFYAAPNSIENIEDGLQGVVNQFNIS